MAKQAKTTAGKHTFEIEGAVAFDDNGKPMQWAKVENAIASTHPTARQANLAADNEILRLTRGKPERLDFFRKVPIEA